MTVIHRSFNENLISITRGLAFLLIILWLFYLKYILTILKPLLWEYIVQLRPISLLPRMNEIFEKVIINSYHSNLLNCLHASQFANTCRSRSSTTLTLITIHGSIVRFLMIPTFKVLELLFFIWSTSSTLSFIIFFYKDCEFIDYLPNCGYLLNWQKWLFV